MRWIVLSTCMLHPPWRASHVPHRPGYLSCLSLGTPRDSLVHRRNNGFWSAALSTSLQTFYTIYTAILLFLTQWLAISRTLMRRVKLTTIHDISGAWTGLQGSTLSSVWRQTDVPASWCTTSTVATYLASITVLHVTSSTLLQFQTFNDSMMTSVPTSLGWLDDSPCGSFANLGLNYPVPTSC
ncbi:hypothetical protein BDR03DRAFT_563623 [Suillus americanus]|nr:hypothetical protein BDR03DRAFT_563623 [Suillus americanus]